jgi:predicted nucleic acid-binding protein
VIVVDATVMADLLAGVPGLQAGAVRLMREDPDWISVGLWRYELGSVLWKMARFEGSDPVEMRLGIARSARILVETVDGLEATAVWDIACGTGLTYYDASYVWLARSRGLELRTRDEEILKKCPDVARRMPRGERDDGG